MSVTIGGITFDRVEYDADGDVLYLHVGDPSRAVDFDETAEGHAVRWTGRATSSASLLSGQSGFWSAPASCV